MAKFNGPREPLTPGEPAQPDPGAAPPSRTPATVTLPEPWTESSFDLLRGLDVIEHPAAPPVPEAPPSPKGR